MLNVSTSNEDMLASQPSRFGNLVKSFFNNYAGPGDETEPGVTGPDRDPVSMATKVKAVVFTLLVGLFSVFILVAFNFMIQALVINWLPDAAFLSIRTDLSPADLTHRLHSTTLTILLWGMVIGTAVQLHRPRRKVAPMLMAIAVPIAIALSEVLTGTYTVGGTAPILVPLVLIGLLHPKARTFVRLPNVDRSLAVLVAVAAIPFLAYAYGQVERHRLTGPTDPHTEMGHWVFMSAIAILILVWGAIAASDHSGWRLTAWVVGVATVMFALQSVLFPVAASRASTPWAVAALVWAIAFLLAAERRVRRQNKHPPA